MALLLILFPFAEIYAFFSFAGAYGFLDALLAIILSGLVGSLIMRMQGKSTLALLQTEVLQGRIPGNQILHRATVFLGGLFLFFPGFISDLIGALCILPGTRHLIVMYMKSLLAKGVLRGRIFMGGFGMPGAGRPWGQHRQAGPSSGRGARHGQQWHEKTQDEPRVERDAQVIDVEPIEITHTPKKDDSQS